MQKRHVLFQEEDKDSYVRSMLEALCAARTGPEVPAMR